MMEEILVEEVVEYVGPEQDGAPPRMTAFVVLGFDEKEIALTEINWFFVLHFREEKIRELLENPGPVRTVSHEEFQRDYRVAIQR